MRTPASLMMRHFLTVLCATALLATAAFAQSATEIPFRFEDGFIHLQVQITGRSEPLHFLLDSGAGASVLSTKTARRLHMNLGAAQRVRGVGSEAVAYQLNDIDATSSNVSLGKVSLSSDLTMADEICGTRVDGLIGIDFFRDRVVQIDYAKRCIRVLERAPAVSEVLAPLATEIINGILCVPVSVNGSQPRPLRLDTGCNDSLHWVVPRRVDAKRKHGVSIGFLTDTNDLSLTNVQIGTEKLSRVETSLHGEPLFPGEAGLLGNGVLSRYTVTIDWKQKQLFLERQKQTEQESGQ